MKCCSGFPNCGSSVVQHLSSSTHNCKLRIKLGMWVRYNVLAVQRSTSSTIDVPHPNFKILRYSTILNMGINYQDL